MVPTLFRIRRFQNITAFQPVFGGMTKRRREAIIDLTSPDEREKVPRTRKRRLITEIDEMGNCFSENRRGSESSHVSSSNTNDPSQNRDGKKLISPISASKKPLAPRKKLLKQSSVKDQNGHRSISTDCIPQSLPLSTANDWDNIDFIYEKVGIDRNIIEVVVKMLENECTIPFIARYRRAQTQGIDADQLRVIKETFEKSKQIKQKADNVIKAIDKAGKWTAEIHSVVRSARTLNELEQIHTLYKETSKRSVAEKARALGLDELAQMITKGTYIANFKNYLNPEKIGLRTEDEVKEGVINILADMMVKDKQIFDMRQKLRKNAVIQIQTKKSKDAGSDDGKKSKVKGDKHGSGEKTDKYDMYFDWSISERNIQPHQILAINRAESQKIISVKLTMPDHYENSLLKFILNLFPAAAKSSFHCGLLTEAFKLGFKKTIKPTIFRKLRSEMSEKAEEASIEVFARNVKQLLLSPPVRGKVVLGIDPGFEHGCKMAVVSAQGDVLETSKIFPHRKNNKTSRQESADLISRIVKKHECRLIALGNATACRETESFLSELISSGIFSPVDVTYTIVDESGTSVYSCGAEAKAEFPNMDYTLISAVSIARRLQDPLAEYVKVDPKSLGVGMYQHDLSERKLMSTLNEVIMEAVSFVGVDVNTASQCLLRRVAGLSETKAENIIAYRRENGPFQNRELLKKVKGIGEKSFEQCAGFIRIMTETSVKSNNAKKSPKAKGVGGKNGRNLLDQTWIHPESYELARKFIEACDVELKDLGTREFISAVNVFAGQGFSVLAKRFKTDEKTLEVIVEGLTMRKGEDIRAGNNAPLFRKSLRSINDLSVGDSLSGEVRNVVHFGAFVDIGVGVNGLIHTQYMQGQQLKISQRVDVEIQNVEKGRNRIGLKLIKAY